MLEVRTYTNSANDAAIAQLSWDIGGPATFASKFRRDFRGVTLPPVRLV